MRAKTISFFGLNNLVFACKGNAKFVNFYMNGKRVILMLDTGASISVIKEDELPRSCVIHYDNLVVNGIGGKICSYGYVVLDLYDSTKVKFQNKFYSFKNLPIMVDGILGLDFMTKYKANIDLDKNLLTMQIDGEYCVLPIYDQPDYSNSLLIPSRCESIHYVYLKEDLEGDCFVSAREIEKDIFLAGTIVRPKNKRIPIKILNTRDEQVRLNNFELNVELLSDYNVFKFSQCDSSSSRSETLLPLLELKHLNKEEKQSIERICTKYSDIFFLPGDKLETTNICEQSIKLKNNINPIYTKPYRLPQALKTEVNKQITKMLKDDIIEESTSEWSSPILLVPKKSESDQKWRLVIDFRKLNENIVDDKFPLPNINDILDSLSGSIYFTHLDLQQGYYQVKLAPESRKYTAFSTSTGHYQLKRLPMGLKTSCSAFSRVMSIAMSGLAFEKCFIYLDDLIIFGRSLTVHNQNLIDVFERLRKVNLKLNPIKCQFLKKEILYLGHLVSADGISPDPEKTKVLEKFPIPQNTDEVRRFVAFCNYYRKFVPSFATITMPLNNLLKKNVPFVWTSECQNAFDFLKTSLMSAPILEYPDFSETNKFILQTDASDLAIGSVLCNSNLKPVAYASRPLNKAERNYPVIQKELTAIVWAVKYFRPYLFGRTFTIMTDHKPLIYLFGMKDPSSRLIKYRLVLEEYDFEILYVKGKDNVVADALSRVCITSDELKGMNEEVVTVMTRGQKRRMDEENRRKMEEKRKEQAAFSNDTDEWPDQPRVVELLKQPCDSIEMRLVEEDIIKKFKKDKIKVEEEECFVYVPSKMVLCINLGFRLHFSRAEFATKLKEFCERIKIKELCIVKDNKNDEFIKGLCSEIKSREEWTGPRICVLKGVKRIFDEREKEFILNDYHLLPTSGHAGMTRMTNNIRRKYYWPNLNKDIRKFIGKCEMCQKMKQGRYTKQPMTLTTTASTAFEKIYLDLVGPLDKDEYGNCYILTLQCELTKYIEAYPLPNKEAVTVAQAFVSNFILRFGLSKSIATDRGTEFISKVMEQVCKLLEIKKLTSTAYHHQSIGSLEIAHKHLGAFLRTYCTNSCYSWSHWLPFWCFSYNTCVNTQTKYTPFELVFGRQCRLPDSISNCNVEPLYNPDDYCSELKYKLQVALRDARNNLIACKVKRKDKYDTLSNPVSYNKDDLILVKNECARKLDCVFDGPFKVVQDLGVNVKIEKNGKIDIIHKDRTKKFSN